MYEEEEQLILYGMSEVKQNVEIKAVKKTMVGERGGKKGAVFKGRVIAAKACTDTKMA